MRARDFAYGFCTAAACARAGDCGIDYSIGEPAAIGRGLGSQLIAVLLDEVPLKRPDSEFIVAPDARNLASRRVLEHNGFLLIEVGPIAGEPTHDPMAIYRRDDPGQPGRHAN
jgi:RimJ/RimL family protein N-acetyltransferase